MRAPLSYDCFAVAAPGLEALVAHELALLGVAGTKAVTGGVEFKADPARLAAVELRTRTASRVIVRIARFRATAFHELERAARKVEWGRFLAEDGAFRLRVTCRKSRLYHSDAVAERVAGAIVRGVKGARDDGADLEDDVAEAPDVAAATAHDAPGAATLPPQLFVVRFERDICTISVDASGELLHRRGYRLAVGRAPLRETLAAAMLIGVEWDPATPLVDPMCGSGTIAIEAAMLARRIAPGLGRAFAAERWPETPRGTWAAARDEAKAEAIDAAPAPIIGADRDEGAIENARANAARAGVADAIEFRQAALSALEVPDAPRGVLLANPPYGVRVGDSAPLRDLFARLGQVARERCTGWRVALLSADRALDAQVKLAFTEVFATSNGGIPVRLVAADVGADEAPRDPARAAKPRRGPRRRG